MNKYKLIVIIFILILFTGCNANYSVNIRSDGKVEEKLTMSFDTNLIEADDKNKFILDQIKNRRDNNMLVDYSIKKDIKSNKSTITAKRIYKSLSDYIEKSEFLPILFEKTSYIDDYGIKGLQTTGEFYYDNIFDMSVSDEPTFDNIDIKVHSQFKLLENNASSIDSDNTMHWNINSENKIFSLNFKYNNSKRYDISIKDYLKENYMSIIVLVILIVSVGIFIRFVIKQNKLTNKI